MIQYRSFEVVVSQHFLRGYFIENKSITQENKPLLVFLHEGLGSCAQWKSFPEKICKSLGLNGLMYDRQGYGISDEVSGFYEVEFLHQEALFELPSLLNALNINQKLILIGHSDGGSIALLFASAFPEQTLAVISEAAHVFFEKISETGIQKVRERFFSDAAFKKGLEKYHGNKTEQLVQRWTGIWLSNAHKSWNIQNNIKDLICPLLVIQGEQDEYGTYEQVDRIVKSVKSEKKKILWLDNCGHIPHFQQPEIVEKSIRNFLSEHFPDIV